MRGSRGLRRLVIVLAAVLPLGGAGLALASPATHQIIPTKAQWQTAIANVAEPGTGCYHASYPVLQWHAVTCTAAPKWPVAPTALPGSAPHAVPATVGDAVDYSAQSAGLISRATGTFRDVSRRITEKGKEDGTGSRVANAFSLQINSQFFSSPACAGTGDPSQCLGWQQFVYDYDAGQGFVFMQYWLINYDAACPSGWFAYQSDCYTNSDAAGIRRLTARDLARLKMSGSAKAGGRDGVSLSVGSGRATLVTNSDSVVDLASFWNTAEWDVFGDGGGGEAFFGARTTLEAKMALTTTSSAAPTCLATGFTAETNNLTLTRTPSLGNEPSPTMASRQTNGRLRTASCAAAAAADTSATSLKLSASKVTYRHEGAEHLTVQVTSPHGAVTGKVKITAKAGKGKPVKVCVITLSSGAGSCTLGRTTLRPGTWKLTAAYGGVPGILTSRSAAKTLRVRR